jgi:hypothetical protein
MGWLYAAIPLVNRSHSFRPRMSALTKNTASYWRASAYDERWTTHGQGHVRRIVGRDGRPGNRWQSMRGEAMKRDSTEGRGLGRPHFKFASCRSSLSTLAHGDVSHTIGIWPLLDAASKAVFTCRVQGAASPLTAFFSFFFPSTLASTV